jgi:ABC-type polysaccharide/polyol phosphate export permease
MRNRIDDKKIYYRLIFRVKCKRYVDLMEEKDSIKSKITKWRSLTIDLSIIFLKLRYKGTVLGFLWSFLEPLLLLSVFYFVFNYILPNNIPNFTLHLFVGLILFFMFSRGTMMGLTSISSNAHIISNLRIPKIILPISYNLTAFIMMLFDFSVFFVYVAITQFLPPITIILLPVFMILVFLLSVGLSLFLSILSVKMKDLNYLWIVITNVIVFFTPIFWRLENMAPAIREILQYSPWIQIITMTQDVVIYNKLPDPMIFLYVTSLVFAILGFGMWVFKKSEYKVTEFL